MGKQAIDKAPSVVKGYFLINATTNTSATRHLLTKMIGLTGSEVYQTTPL